MFVQIVQEMQPGLALLQLVLVFLCVRYWLETRNPGMGWLALAIVGYGINHLITAVLHLTGPAVFVLMVGLASICQMSFLVGFRLLAGISPESGPGEARRLFAVGSVVVALAILLTFRIAPVLVHVVSSVIVAYTAALHWRLCRAQPDQGYGLIALLMLSHPVVLCVLVLTGVAPAVVRDVMAFVYLAIGYSVVSATLSRASSELTRATKELRVAEARWSFALEGSSQGVWDWNMRGEQAYYSPRLEQMLDAVGAGRAPTPARWLELLHPDDVLPMRSALSRHLAGEAPFFDVEYRVRGLDAAVTWFAARGSVIERSAAGEPLRMIGTVSDVSVRKSTELALAASLRQLEERKRQVDTLNVQLARRAVDAETAVRAKDAFLRNVTHEFRTPLNHISGAANLLALSPLDEKQLKWLTMILDGSRNLLRRVDTTIDVARLEAGALVIEAVDFSLPAVLDQVIGLVLHRARDKGLKLSLEAPSDIPPVLSGDPTRLTQMLLNYLDNAITFTEEGSIVVRALRLRSDEQVVTLRFEVTDTGPGIDPELRKTLFAPFMQGDTSMTRTYSGLGVGLAITRQLARLMAGDAGVESAPGKGSTFWITASFSCAVSRTR